jgi:predicted lipoprotein with Yx(FWY)xxD motif
MTSSAKLGILTAVAATALSAGAISGCGGGSAAPSTSGGTAAVVPPKTASGETATVGVASTGSLGKILVDSKGNTLYLFEKDTGGKSACTGGCAAAWPPLRASGKPVAGTSLAGAKLATTPRSDGKPQVTYNGHPLYLYAADQNPGDVTGQGVNAFGAVWYVMSPAGDAITTAVAGNSPGYSGGY